MGRQSWRSLTRAVLNTTSTSSRESDCASKTRRTSTPAGVTPLAPEPARGRGVAEYRAVEREDQISEHSQCDF